MQRFSRKLIGDNLLPPQTSFLVVRLAFLLLLFKISFDDSVINLRRNINREKYRLFISPDYGTRFH